MPYDMWYINHRGGGCRSNTKTVEVILMNVRFSIGEVVNGWKCVGVNGLSRFVFEELSTKDRIVFDSDAGEGVNYCKIIGYYNARTNRHYEALRFLFKCIPTMQMLSSALYERYVEENGGVFQ